MVLVGLAFKFGCRGPDLPPLWADCPPLPDFYKFLFHSARCPVSFLLVFFFECRDAHYSWFVFTSSCSEIGPFPSLWLFGAQLCDVSNNCNCQVPSCIAWEGKGLGQSVEHPLYLSPLLLCPVNFSYLGSTSKPSTKDLRNWQVLSPSLFPTSVAWSTSLDGVEFIQARMISNI